MIKVVSNVQMRRRLKRNERRYRIFSFVGIPRFVLTLKKYTKMHCEKFKCDIVCYKIEQLVNLGCVM